MAWYSLLPSNLIYVESWAVKVFVLLGFVTICPWLALIFFDMVLYVFRVLVHEIPFVGGRARGMQRPHAPTLNEIPERPRRALGLDGGYNDTNEKDVSVDIITEGELKRRSGYERDGSVDY